MNNSYLIPANSKKSMLIFGFFTRVDLIIFGSGIALTLFLTMILPIETFSIAMLSLLPAGIGLLLVFPVPNYHNVLTAIKSMYKFYTNRRSYIWKGWCVKEYEKEEK